MGNASVQIEASAPNTIQYMPSRSMEEIQQSSHHPSAPSNMPPYPGLMEFGPGHGPMMRTVDGQLIFDGPMGPGGPHMGPFDGPMMPGDMGPYGFSGQQGPMGGFDGPGGHMFDGPMGPGYNGPLPPGYNGPPGSYGGPGHHCFDGPCGPMSEFDGPMPGPGYMGGPQMPHGFNGPRHGGPMGFHGPGGGPMGMHNPEMFMGGRIQMMHGDKLMMPGLDGPRLKMEPGTGGKKEKDRKKRSESSKKAAANQQALEAGKQAMMRGGQANKMRAEMMMGQRHEMLDPRLMDPRFGPPMRGGPMSREDMIREFGPMMDGPMMRPPMSMHEELAMMRMRDGMRDGMLMQPNSMDMMGKQGPNPLGMFPGEGMPSNQGRMIDGLIPPSPRMADEMIMPDGSKGQMMRPGSAAMMMNDNGDHMMRPGSRPLSDKAMMMAMQQSGQDPSASMRPGSALMMGMGQEIGQMRPGSAAMMMEMAGMPGMQMMRSDGRGSFSMGRMMMEQGQMRPNPNDPLGMMGMMGGDGGNGGQMMRPSSANMMAMEGEMMMQMRQNEVNMQRQNEMLMMGGNGGNEGMLMGDGPREMRGPLIDMGMMCMPGSRGPGRMDPMMVEMPMNGDMFPSGPGMMMEGRGGHMMEDQFGPGGAQFHQFQQQLYASKKHPGSPSTPMMDMRGMPPGMQMDMMRLGAGFPQHMHNDPSIGMGR